MPNFTIEDYKEAIIAKYEKDINNPVSDGPISLGQAYLRDFCWEKFEGGLSQNDLRVFASFFGFEFDPVRRNLFRDHTDRFRPIGTFLKRQTDLTSRDAVNLTAILVDFQHRPFRKFQERGIINYLQHPEDVVITEPLIQKNEDTDEVKEEDNDNHEEINSVEEPPADNLIEENQIKGFADIKPDLNKKQESEKLEQVEVMTIVSTPPEGNLPSSTKKKFVEIFYKRLKRTVIAAIFIFCLIGAVVYFAFFQKHCMQWSEDHYEVVDCTANEDEVILNEIIPLDKDLLGFKKLKACDTTICFMKSGEAFVWYAKTGNGIEFFNDNGNGKHPETKGALRPVSHYIFNKYLRGKPCE